MKRNTGLTYIIITAFYLLVYLLISFTTSPYIPNYLNVSSDNFQDFCNATLSIAGSIFGIVMAIFLIATQFSKDSQRLLHKESILYSFEFAFFISLSVSIIVISYLGVFQEGNLSEIQMITLKYFIAISLMVYLVATAPLIYRELSKSDESQLIKNLLDGLDNSDFEDHWKNKYRLDYEVNFNNKLIELKSELEKAAESHNTNLIRKANNQFTDKVVQLLKSENKEENINQFISNGAFYIWGNLNRSLKSNNLEDLNPQIWSFISHVYSAALNNNNRDFIFYFLTDFEDYLEEFLNKKNNSDYVGSQDCLFDMLRKSIQQMSSRNTVEDCLELIRLIELFKDQVLLSNNFSAIDHFLFRCDYQVTLLISFIDEKFIDESQGEIILILLSNIIFEVNSSVLENDTFKHEWLHVRPNITNIAKIFVLPLEVSSDVIEHRFNLLILKNEKGRLASTDVNDCTHFLLQLIKFNTSVQKMYNAINFIGKVFSNLLFQLELVNNQNTILLHNQIITSVDALLKSDKVVNCSIEYNWKVLRSISEKKLLNESTGIGKWLRIEE